MHLSGFEILMSQDHLGDALQGDPVAARIGSRVSPQVAYRGGDFAASGNLVLDGAVTYVAGNLTVTGTGSVSGPGRLICIGDFTVASGVKLKMKNPTGYVLGVGGKLVIQP